jgi:hypothetical protein
MSEPEQKFIAEMMQLGILSFTEQETLWDIAQRCAMTAGVPMAGFGVVALGKVGMIMVPGVGALPGAVVGALAGLAGGTMSCVILNTSVREQLRELARGT